MKVKQKRTFVALPNSRFKTGAKIVRNTNTRLQCTFYCEVYSKQLDHIIRLPILPSIKTWSEAVTATRDLLYMVDACLCYINEEAIELPPHMEDLADEIPAYCNKLQPRMAYN